MTNDTTQHTPADVRERVAREVFVCDADWRREYWDQFRLDFPRQAQAYYDTADRILGLLRTPSGEGTLQALRDRINARLQTSAISRDRASAAGRELVAHCRQSDVETLEWVLSEIDALLRTPRGEEEAWRAFLDALDEVETAAASLWADPEGPTAADMERLRQSRQRVIECARALAGLPSTEDAARRGEGGGA